MHGLVNRSLQAFLNDTYGYQLWEAVAQDIDMDPSGVEAMVQLDDGLTELLVSAAARRLDKPRDALLEDVGAYLVSRESLRRLLRFSGPELLPISCCRWMNCRTGSGWRSRISTCR